MSFTIVIPCFNESARWRPEYWAELSRIEDSRWIFVDDGSTDETHSQIMNLDCDSVETIRLPQNMGKGEAVRKGLLVGLETKTDWVGFLDADGAFPSIEVNRILALTRASNTGCKAVWTSRVALRGRAINRKESRHYLGRLVATALGTRISDLPYDSQSGFKLFRVTPELEAALAEPFRTRWLFDVELLERLDSAFGTTDWMWEEPVTAWSDVDGSKVSRREIVRVIKEMMTIMTKGA